MTFLVEQLEQIDRHLADVLAAGEDAAVSDGVLGGLSDAELVTVLQVLGRVQRRVDGAIEPPWVLFRSLCERSLGCV